LNEFVKRNPKLGLNFLNFVSFAYQLLYYKLGNKRMSLNVQREKNLYPTGFYKFDINNKQKEYLEIISLSKEDDPAFLIPINLRKELQKLNIEFTVLKNLIALFNYVKSNTQKLGKSTKDAMNTFINDEKLFITYFDFISKYSVISEIK
jgi:hypothetical protein